MLRTKKLQLVSTIYRNIERIKKEIQNFNFEQSADLEVLSRSYLWS